VGGTILDAEGREVLGRRKGYRYFGWAKELPGIKEMFERAAKRRVTGGDNDDEKRIVTNSGPLVLGSVSVLVYGLAVRHWHRLRAHTDCLLYSNNEHRPLGSTHVLAVRPHCLLYLVGLLPLPLFFRFVALV
jgi:hypothetical protein